MNLLPHPRHLKRGAGFYQLPRHARLQLDASLPRDVSRAVFERLQSLLKNIGVQLESERRKPRGGPKVFRSSEITCRPASGGIRNAGGYTLEVSSGGVLVEFQQPAGLRAA